MAGKTRVTINHGWAVAVDGKQYSGGQTVNVDQDTADRWIASGWAVRATEPATKAKTGTTPTTKAGTRTRRPAPSP